MSENFKDFITPICIVVGFIILVFVLSLTGFFDDSDKEYSEYDYQRAKEEAYQEGYREGFEAGLETGWERGYNDCFEDYVAE